VQPTKSNIQSRGDLGGSKVAMSVDAASMEHIMSVLTDLYSDPIQAVIREYSTNAYDSHVASGQTRPIEVTLPSPLNANFIVKDYGLGLSVDDIVNIYSQYGASTKRDDNTQSGMLGLGCKSGLTYADQFLVSSVKNGVKVSVVVSRSDSGAGQMEIIDTASTTLPNGVEITIPVNLRDVTSFSDKSAEFYSYWPADSVLVNGEQPKSFLSGKGVIKLSDDLYLSRSDTHKIVMGNVAYSHVDRGRGSDHVFNNLDSSSYYSSWSVIYFAKMGEVNFTPSRESLHMTNLTKRTLDRVVAQADALSLSAIQNLISSAESFGDAWFLLNQWRGIFKQKSITDSKFTYRGSIVPQVVNFDGLELFLDKRGNRHHQKRTSVTHTSVGGLFITGLSQTDAAIRDRIALYIENQGIEPNGIFITKDDVTDPFLSECKIVSWDALKAATPYSKSPSRKNPNLIPNQYNAYVINGKSGIQRQDVPNEGNTVWISTADFLSLAGYHRGSLDEQRDHSLSRLRSMLPSHNFVIVNANQIDKFVRNYPNVPNYLPEIRKVATVIIAHRTKHDVLYSRLDALAMRDMAKWDETKVNDPDVRTLIADCRAALDSKWQSFYGNQYAAIVRQTSLSDLTNDDDISYVQNTLAKYPMITVDSVSRHNSVKVTIPAATHDHIYQYLNFFYEGTI